jgi:hypothetical protein
MKGRMTVTKRVVHCRVSSTQTTDRDRALANVPTPAPGFIRAVQPTASS